MAFIRMNIWSKILNQKLELDQSLCSDHFRPDMLSKTSTNRKRLCSEAVPYIENANKGLSYLFKIFQT